MKYIYYIAAALLLILFSAGCSKNSDNKDNNKNTGSRVIKFAGYDWEVRSSVEKAGPGPNYFSNSENNVWVDSSGKLHLKITNKNGKWSCAGITLLAPAKYGEYVFETEVDPNLWDDFVVGGLFLYKNDDTEIDIEFSRWGQKDNLNSQFVVQPGTKKENKRRFDIDSQSLLQTTIINWSSESVSFYNYNKGINDINNENLFYNWTYIGSDNPSDNEDLALKINLWLFRGTPPKDNAEYEFIVSNFKIR